MKSAEIRQAFIDFFKQQGHQAVSSASLVPASDPTLLFTNAGMVPFKDTFLGIEKRPYTKAVTSQRCVRAGGKHNDLENVGYTARHHTFFEMLGNFSFGDYFKEEAIQYAWDFLTNTLQLPEEKLWVTVYTDDDEAADIWLKKIGVSSKRFSRCGEKDNFWSMGDTGPCGPCSEIFYDHGPEIAGGPPGSPDEDGDRFIEIWNIVFMQYNRDKAGNLTPLPKPSVDTGMGLERLTAVVQGVHNNFEIDSFQHLIQAIQTLGKNIDEGHPSARVIADHIRACAFLICDGVIPSNEGRGYVLRRIIRRAIRHGNKLKLPSPFFHQLVGPLVSVMGSAYPELKSQQRQIEQRLQQEETQFLDTLEQGLHILQHEMKSIKGSEIPGNIAFKLYDTYGFPFDLTADIAREHNLTVDETGFNECMEQQRERSKASTQFKIDYTVDQQLDMSSTFQGYDTERLETRITALLRDQKRSEQLQAGDNGAIILDDTPFYAESGGQVSDQGTIRTKNAEFRVDDTQKVGQAIVHYGAVIQGTFKLNETVETKINHRRRNAIRLNHTATHLLHAALKQLIGDHVQQKGSLVDAERARFDFSHNKPLTSEQLSGLEALVNEQIRENHSVETAIMSIDDAKKSGAMALFGEKYSDTVRVLTIDEFSKELCGGTHVKKTGDIGLFKIIAEYGIASGVRRIDMMTGGYALDWVNHQLALLDGLATTLKTKPQEAAEKLSQLMLAGKRQEKKLNQLEQKLAAQSSDNLLEDVQTIGNVKLLVKELDNQNGQNLRTLMDQLRSSLNDAVIVLVSKHDNKMSVVAGVSQSILGQVPPAPEYVRHLCGKGGGRDDMAQGGGPIPTDLAKKLNTIQSLIV